MNVLSKFEERVGAIFGESPLGKATPFSFKKLAKRAVKAMENETYVINGVDVAPALFTVCVSETDAQTIRPYYARIVQEATRFVKEQANKKGYSFVGQPLFRFVPDPSLRSGRFSVFAENVDAATLQQLTQEEQAFIGVENAHARNARARRANRISSYTDKPAPEGSTSDVAPERSASNVLVSPANNLREYREDEMGLMRIPDEPDSSLGVPSAVGAGRSSAVDAAGQAAVGVAGSAVVATAAGSATMPAPTPLVTIDALRAASATQERELHPATCLLIDRSTGRTYTATAPTTIIGRERLSHSVVLRDPNISRRHAELSYDGRNWIITDLNSTNGTLINNVDIDRCILRDGDLITVGLVNLEFRGDRA